MALERCFEIHSFYELNNIDVGMLRRSLQRFKSSLTADSVIFDVGANAGSFLQAIDSDAPVVKNIHCFEPHPIIAKKTKEKYPYIKMNEFCLGRNNGLIDIHIPQWSVGLSSNIRRPMFDSVLKNQEIVTLNVKCQTIDSYCLEHGIQTIDFLKIDVEGSEKSVLDGAEGMLQSKRIRGGIFEIGDTLAEAGTSVQEICTMLENYGYTIDRKFDVSNYVFYF